MITSPYHHSLLLIYVNLEIIINNYFNVCQGGGQSNYLIEGNNSILLLQNIFCNFRYTSGGDNGNIFLHENILKIISKCILVVSGMINSPQLQSLILIYVNLGIFNRFFSFASGGGQPKYVIEANTRHVGPTCYCKVEIISIGHYLMGKYIFFNKLS